MNKENKRLTPFIHWVGGKGQSIKEIVPYFQSYNDRYWEPMIGGGSLFLWTKPLNAVISDINAELINVWRCVKDYTHLLIRHLERHKRNHSEEYYYKIRDKFNEVKLTGTDNPAQVDNAGMFIPHNLEVFYKRVEKVELADGSPSELITYYRQYHKGLEKGDQVLIFSFSQFDEWIQVDGKWRSKYGEGQNANKKAWKEFNNDDK